MFVNTGMRSCPISAYFRHEWNKILWFSFSFSFSEWEGTFAKPACSKPYLPVVYCRRLAFQALSRAASFQAWWQNCPQQYLAILFAPSAANAKELTRLRLNSPQTFREVNCCDPTHKRGKKCTYPMSLQASLLAAAQLSFTHERNSPATKQLFQLFLLYSYYCSVFSKPQLCKTLQLPGPDPHQL